MLTLIMNHLQKVLNAACHPDQADL
jgi:hypothetical protein